MCKMTELLESNMCHQDYLNYIDALRRFRAYDHANGDIDIRDTYIIVTLRTDRRLMQFKCRGDFRHLLHRTLPLSLGHT